MLTDAVRQDIAAKIYRCFQEKTQIPLLSASNPGMEMEDVMGEASSPAARQKTPVGY